MSDPALEATCGHRGQRRKRVRIAIEKYGFCVPFASQVGESLEQELIAGDALEEP